MKNSTRKIKSKKSQKGGQINIDKTNNSQTYRLINSLNANILNRIRNSHKLKTNARTKLPREVAVLTVRKDSNNETIDIVKQVMKVRPGSIKGRVAFLGFVTNNWDGSFLTNPNTASSITEAEKQNIFGPNHINLKINPEKDKYFLKRGAATILMKKAIEDFKSEGYGTILLHANTPGLVNYYKKFNFEEIPGVDMWDAKEGDEPPPKYGDGGTGPIMFLTL